MHTFANLEEWLMQLEMINITIDNNNNNKNENNEYSNNNDFGQCGDLWVFWAVFLMFL